MPTSIIRTAGRAKTAKLPNGETVERADVLKMTDGWYICLPTELHFIYKNKRLGSTIMCTCGSEAALISYTEYKKYASWIANEVIMCLNLAQHGCHRDGSTE